MSIKATLTIFTLVVFLTGVWSLALYYGKLMYEDLVELEGQRQFATVSLLATQVDKELADRLAALDEIARRITPSQVRNSAALQASLEDRVLLTALFNGGTMVVGIDGTAIADVPRSTGRTGVSYADREYIATALADGRTTIGKPVKGRKLPAPVIGMAAPIRDADGKVIGALVGVTDLAKPNFLSEITGSRYGKTGGYLITAPAHRLIVTASDKSRIMETLPVEGAIPTMDRLLKGQEGPVVFVNRLGVENLSSGKNIPTSGWRLVATLPTEEAFAPMRAMQQNLMIGTALLTMLAGLLVWWMTAAMLRQKFAPMIEATRTLGSLSGTDQRPRPLPIVSHDEISELISGFNRLMESLAEKGEALSDAQRIAKIGSWMLDLSSSKLTWSDEIFRLFEIDPKQFEATYEAFLNAIHPEDRDAVSRAYSESLVNRSPYDITHRLLMSDGRIKWVQERCDSEFDETGEPLRSIGTVQDITERKQHDEAIRTAKERLEMALSGGDLGLWDWHIPSGAVLYSERWYSMLGYRVDELKLDVDSWLNLIHPDDLAGVHSALESHIAGEVAFYECEHRVRHKDGHWLWLLDRGKVVQRDQAGVPVRAVGTYMDITKRKEAEKTLRESEERYRLLAENSHDVIWTIDLQTGRFTYVSPSVERLRGFTPAEIMAQPMEAALTPESIVTVNTAMQDMLTRIAAGDRTHLTSVNEVEQPHRDGHIIHTEVVTTYILDDAGKPISILGVTRDITERKKAELELERLAQVDSLTGLSNRRHFMSLAEEELSRALRYGGVLSVCMMDIDHFKEVNDTYGHQAGDIVLQKLGEICREALRDIDRIGRIGGEEFAVMLPQTDGVRAIEVAERLRQIVQNTEVILERGRPLRFTLSIGVTTLEGGKSNLDMLLGQADSALYKAKHLGRNKVCTSWEPSA